MFTLNFIAWVSPNRLGERNHPRHLYWEKLAKKPKQNKKQFQRSSLKHPLFRMPMQPALPDFVHPKLISHISPAGGKLYPELGSDLYEQKRYTCPHGTYPLWVYLYFVPEAAVPNSWIDEPYKHNIWSFSSNTYCIHKCISPILFIWMEVVNLCIPPDDNECGKRVLILIQTDFISKLYWKLAYFLGLVLRKTSKIVHEKCRVSKCCYQ